MLAGQMNNKLINLSKYIYIDENIFLGKYWSLLGWPGDYLVYYETSRIMYWFLYDHMNMPYRPGCYYLTLCIKLFISNISLVKTNATSMWQCISKTKLTTFTSSRETGSAKIPVESLSWMVSNVVLNKTANGSSSSSIAFWWTITWKFK